VQGVLHVYGSLRRLSGDDRGQARLVRAPIETESKAANQSRTKQTPSYTHHEANPLFTRSVSVFGERQTIGLGRWATLDRHGKATTQAMCHTLHMQHTLRGMFNDCACAVTFIL
jgi:hypothetical protein